MRDIEKEYQIAKEQYAEIGVDVDKALERMNDLRIRGFVDLVIW